MALLAAQYEAARAACLCIVAARARKLGSSGRVCDAVLQHREDGHAIAGLFGLIAGDLLGQAIGVKANVGGVGIAMLLLLFFTNLSATRFTLGPIASGGITFWSAMYIPIVVAMAASQNVLAAIQGGPLALVAGVLVVVASFAMVPLISRLGPTATDVAALHAAEPPEKDDGSA